MRVEGEAFAGAVQALGGLSMAALSQHLAMLRESGLVLTRRDTQSILYSLADSAAPSAMQARHAACSMATDTRRA
ncbi:MAG: hypothetical protein ACOH1V_04540 [Stenotrophomonas sp.]